MKSRLLPPLVLFLITPLIAEYLLGSLSVAQIGALPVLCLMYGGGSVLIREIARATGRGWPGIVWLGLGYAVLEEAIATQSLFNPHYLHLRLLDYGYLPALGIGAPWTLYVLSLHVIWSVCVPIALVEAMFPEVGTTPWMGWVGRSVFGLLLALGFLAVTAYTKRTEQFMAQPTQFAVAALVILTFVLLGIRGPRGTPAPGAHAAPRPWLIALGTLLLGSAFELTQHLQHVPAPWPLAMVAMIVALGIGITLLRRWSAGAGWSAQHRFAAAVGGLLVYCWWGYGVEISLHGSGGLATHTILVAAAIAMLVVVGLRLQRHSLQKSPGPELAGD